MQSIYIWLDNLTLDEIFIIGVYGIILALAVLIIIELVKSPKGYEDESGFHYGTPEEYESIKHLSNKLAESVQETKLLKREIERKNIRLKKQLKEYEDVNKLLVIEKSIGLDVRKSNTELKRKLADAESNLKKQIDANERIIKESTDHLTRAVNAEAEVKRLNGVINSLNNEILLRNIEVA